MGSRWLTIKQGTLNMTIEDKTTEILPNKSLSLRRSSVAKRLLTEQKRSQPKTKEKISKKYRLSKYRRKTENAKERERMKKFNQAFQNLRKMLPDHGLSLNADKKAEKDTKVSSLRSAITYINCLQELLEDCDAGRVGEEVYRKSSLLDTKEKEEVKEKRNVKKKNIKPRGKISKKNIKSKDLCGKWINYSRESLEQKFGLLEPRMKNCDLNPGSQTQTVITYTTSPSSVQNNPVVSPSSPRDVNEVSLHISILDTCRDSGGDTGTLQYVYAVTQI